MDVLGENDFQDNAKEEWIRVGILPRGNYGLRETQDGMVLYWVDRTCMGTKPPELDPEMQRLLDVNLRLGKKTFRSAPKYLLMRRYRGIST